MLKKLTLVCSLLLIGVTVFCQQLPPKSATLVTDYTNTLSAGDKQQLESKLVAFNDSTTTQIAIVIIKSVGQYDIDDYAQKLGRAWGIGTKGKNNGVLVLVALTDRKVSIQTGYGAEGAVPDADTHQIIQNDIVPRFKQGDYYGGLNAASDDLMKLIKGEYKAPVKAKGQDQGGGGSIWIFIVIVVIIIVAIFRGRGGNGGQIYGGRGGASPFWWFLGGAMLGRGSGGWGGFSGGGGGDSGGGGGFGGFGGGDFGGGGSSGSW